MGCECQSTKNNASQQRQTLMNNEQNKQNQYVPKDNNINEKIDIKKEKEIISNNKQFVITNFELKNYLECHNDNIIYLIELYNKKIMTCSYDKTSKIWDLTNLNCEKVIQNEDIVMCLLEFIPDMVLFGLQSGIIELIDLKNPEGKKIYFKGHLLYVNCLVKCNDKFFASASNDTYIRIWDYYKGECVNILSGHNQNIFCLIKLDEDKLCSAGADKEIKIWNWKMNKCEATLTGHKSWIKSLYKLKNGNIISGSDDGIIKIWENNIEIKELIGHQDSIKSICGISDNYIASASFDKTIKIWDLNTGNCVQTLDGHSDKVNCILYHSDGYLISCSSDKTIKIWIKKKITNFSK